MFLDTLRNLGGVWDKRLASTESDKMETFVSANYDDVRWQCSQNLRPAFFESTGLPLEKWRNDRCLHIVKKAAHRTVYRVRLPQVRFYLKHYPKSDVRAWFRQLVRPSKARMECDKALEIAKRGVATVEPLAIGERASLVGSGESYLITRELDDTQPLNEFLADEFPQFPDERLAALRRSLAIRLGAFLAQLHDAGIRHDDLHAGNLLVRLSPSDEPTLFLIDLHAVQLGERLDWPASCDNLVLFNRWFCVFTERSDRGRFWKAYCCARCRYADDALARSFADKRQTDSRAYSLEQTTWESNVDFWRRRDARCLTKNRYFRRVQSGACRGFAVVDLDSDFLKRLSENPDAPFGQPGNPILKDSRSSTVVELQAPIAGATRPVIYKRINATKWGDSWKAITGRSGLWRSWVFGHGLLHRALPTARPLAVIHRQRSGVPSRGYLLMEKISNASNLREFMTSLQDAAPQKRRVVKIALLARLAQLIRHMHRCRLSHRDLKATNILVQPVDEAMPIDTSPPVWFIDLEGLRRWSKELPRRRCIKDLTRLNASFVDQAMVTRSDRLRFLRLYLQCAWKGRSNWKLWWNEISKATERKMRQNKRRRRPLA